MCGCPPRVHRPGISSGHTGIAELPLEYDFSEFTQNATFSINFNGKALYASVKVQIIFTL